MKVSLPEVREKLVIKSFKDVYMLTYLDEEDNTWKIEQNFSSDLKYKQPKLFHHISTAEGYAKATGYEEYNAVKIIKNK